MRPGEGALKRPLVRSPSSEKSVFNEVESKGENGKAIRPLRKGEFGNVSFWKSFFSEEEKIHGETQFPRVVACLQLLSYLLLTLLTLGPVAYYESETLLQGVGGLSSHSSRISHHVANFTSMWRPKKFKIFEFHPDLGQVRTNAPTVRIVTEQERDRKEGEKDQADTEVEVEETEAEKVMKQERISKASSESSRIQSIMENFLQGERRWVTYGAEVAKTWAKEESSLVSALDGFIVDEASSKANWFAAPFHDNMAVLERRTRLLIERLAQEAQARIAKGVPCIPQVCYSKTTFFDAENHDIAKLFLVSFPGSGNTWLRTVIRAGTRKYTGSLYGDKKLAFNQGFQGELLNPEDPKTSVVKSHFPLWKQGHPNKFPGFKASILILRSPFDSILAELNRVQSGQSHTGVASNEYLQGDGQKRARYFSNLFNQFVHFWEGLNAVNQKSKTPVFFPGNGVSDYRGTRVRDVREMFTFDIRPMRYGKGHPVFTMFYEDFQRDFVKSLTYLFAFLKLQHADKMPSVYESVLCVLSNTKLFTHTKRKATRQVNPFISSAEEFCKTFAFTWNKEKWGDCSGLLQKERQADVQNAPKDWRNEINLPSETCAY